MVHEIPKQHIQGTVIVIPLERNKTVQRDSETPWKVEQRSRATAIVTHKPGIASMLDSDTCVYRHACHLMQRHCIGKQTLHHRGARDDGRTVAINQVHGDGPQYRTIRVASLVGRSSYAIGKSFDHFDGWISQRLFSSASLRYSPLALSASLCLLPACRCPLTG